MWILGVPFKTERKRRTKERDALISGYITETTGVRAAPARAEQTWRALLRALFLPGWNWGEGMTPSLVVGCSGGAGT